MNEAAFAIRHHQGMSLSTHHPLGYPLAGWFSPEPASVSPSVTSLQHVTSNTTRHASENLGGLGAGPHAHCALRQGLRKSFSESILTVSKTVADPFWRHLFPNPIFHNAWYIKMGQRTPACLKRASALHFPCSWPPILSSIADSTNINFKTREQLL